MFAENVIPFLTVPYFAIQSKFDKWQLQHELSLPLDYNSWNEGEETYADVDIINYANGLEHNLLHAFDWRQQQKEKQRGGGQQATNNGLFLHSCLLHSIHKLESCYEHIYIEDSDSIVVTKRMRTVLGLAFHDAHHHTLILLLQIGSNHGYLMIILLLLPNMTMKEEEVLQLY